MKYVGVNLRIPRNKCRKLTIPRYMQQVLFYSSGSGLVKMVGVATLRLQLSYLMLTQVERTHLSRRSK